MIGNAAVSQLTQFACRAMESLQLREIGLDRERFRKGERVGGAVFANAYRFGPSDDPADGGPGARSTPETVTPESEDLGYKVELWDRNGDAVEQVLAITSSPSIGYAAYYAATREFPDAVITLRHKNSIMTKWGGKPH
ncbi:MAG: hypothetical protein P4L73_18345 [Caulobacteraceae bacterium]|nr:hypothetical protein [Caulobacteraceae bacterium]